jgi:rod shape determining protein RodA
MLGGRIGRSATRGPLSTAGADRSGFPVDPILLGAIALLAMIGVVNLYSATSVYSGARSELYISHVYWLLTGGVVGGLLMRIDYRRLMGWAYGAYALGIAALLVVIAFAKDVRGSSRWIEFGSFRFQPSEFMKVLLVLALARALEEGQRNSDVGLRELILPLALTALPAFLVGRQPDLGTALILVAVMGGIVIMLPIRRRLWLSTIAAAAVVGPLMWRYFLHDYQKKRVLTFLNPEADVLSSGWHATQSRIAIGHGGLLGEGFMQGSQNQFLFLPDQFSDFPFPVLAEEWGLLGAFFLLSLYAVICLRMLQIGACARDRFGTVLCVGAASIWFLHVFINVGMTSGIVPVVGVPLPLLSHGGSNITTMLVAQALVLSVSHHTRRASRR